MSQDKEVSKGYVPELKVTVGFHYVVRDRCEQGQ